MTSLEILDAAVEWGQRHGRPPNKITVGPGVYNSLPMNATHIVPKENGWFGQALALEWYVDLSLPSDAMVFEHIEQ